MSAHVEKRNSTEVLDSVDLKTKNESVEQGRKWSKAKIAFTVVAGIALGLLAIASLVMLVFFSVIIDPSIGTTLVDLSLKAAPIAAKVVELGVNNPIPATIAGLGGLITTALGVTGLTIFNKTSEEEEGADTDSGDEKSIHKVSDGEEHLKKIEASSGEEV